MLVKMQTKLSIKKAVRFSNLHRFGENTKTRFAILNPIAPTIIALLLIKCKQKFYAHFSLNSSSKSWIVI